MFSLLEQIATWALGLISKTGYWGLFLAMSLESAGIPIPSEVVLPFAGFLSSSGRFNLPVVIFVTSLANLTGSLVFYFIGYYGGTRVLRKYGRYVLIHEEEISKLEKWMHKHGGKVAFFSRMLPGVRTYSSIVIGSGRSKLPTFILYTVIGSVLWNCIWGYLGYYAGSRWNIFEAYVRKFDYLIIGVLIIFIITFFVKHFHGKK